MDVLIAINDIVTLNCEATGVPPITYHWESSNINGEEWTKFGNSNSKKLTVKNLEQSEKYRCVASNNAGRTESNPAIVSVLSKYML